MDGMILCGLPPTANITQRSLPAPIAAPPAASNGATALKAMLRLLSGKCGYSETHNAICDAVDELEIIRLLEHPLSDYPGL